MAVTVPHDQWTLARTALKETGDRFADLVTGASDPGAMATKEWTVAETAAHVVVISRLYTAMVRADGSPPPIGGLEAAFAPVTIENIGLFNDLSLERFPERVPRVLAARLRDDIAEILRITADADPATPVPWLGGSIVPIGGLLAHLVNEMLLHGWDIASAAGSRWPIPAPHAALFFNLFLLGMLAHDTGRLLTRPGPLSPRRIAIRFHSRHTIPATLVVQHGDVTAEPPGPAPDAHVAFAPATLNLMLFGRISRPRAILTGGLTAWGRRPWLLPEFLRTVRVPTIPYARGSAAEAH
ncbi:maleylpyruvate isomerase family mycothiol-dependent enzyme [Sphaerisporangium aureirubrum]|uniref:Maleylpyruvate isomerase family mycothiol-dependent enzyme n=1 Tax=Sphaerisporangium aureirubrum TaxID=1544736 RepID=A0ABW1NDX4_9ACTN